MIQKSPTNYHIFFDDGGVLNDNERRGAEWKKFIPKYFIPRFGGTEQLWANVNHRVIEELWRELFIPHIQSKIRIANFNSWWEDFMKQWIQRMFQYAKIPQPDEDPVGLFKEISHFVIPQVRSINEGVKETIQILFEKGYKLHTASGQISWELKDYLVGMGIDHAFFKNLFGPDLINESKFTLHFYEKIFDKVGISPSQAIIIDDNEFFLENARETGAQIIQSCINVSKRKVAKYRVYNFRQIPDIVEILTKC